MAVKVNEVVPGAGEALGELGRWGRGWSPECSQHPVLSSRVSAAGLGVGVLGSQGTHFFGTLEDLWNPRGAARSAWVGQRVALLALLSFRVIASCWAFGGAPPRLRGS